MLQSSVDDRETVTEGSTKLLIPPHSEGLQRIPAFFNPKGKFTRDVSIACYRSFAKSSGFEGKLNFADALCGVGARGIRVANEIGQYFLNVFLNDVNSRALEYARASAELNSVGSRCIFSKQEACAFLNSREGNQGERFDALDIDPFGTPAPFVESAIRATRDRGMLSLTATDSAVLCGVYSKVALRKYIGTSIRTDYSDEIGLRLIFGLAAFTAMRLEAGIEPLFCHHDMHYFRAYCRVEVGNRYSTKNQTELGYVAHCFRCGYRSTIGYYDVLEKRHAEAGSCPNCQKNRESGRLRIAGPLWIGKLQSLDFVRDCAALSEISLFHVKELDIPLYYDLSFISKDGRTRTPKLGEVAQSLTKLGHQSSRTRLNPNGLRTDAPIDLLRSVVAELAR